MRHRKLALAGALAAVSAPVAQAKVRDVWVAAVPTWWNIAPNGHDAIMGVPVDPAEAIFPTVVYRRYCAHWRRPEANATRANADGLLIPGPLIHARVGDLLRVHFKNLDNLRHAPHSMHFHGVHYAPSSDGAYVPGFSGRDADVKYGQSYTYRLRAGPDSVGVWPYHDHSPSMDDSSRGGM
jgi:manganese oxidase